jgi:DNA-binding GntR family transcriptional regulator
MGRRPDMSGRADPAAEWEQIERGLSLSDKTYVRLKEIIISGDLRPDQIVNEIDLARRLGISRSPLREALRQLQEEGLVEGSGRGMRVAPVTRRGVIELYELRLALESFAARKAAGRIGRQEIDAAQAELERTAQPLARGDVSPFTDLDFQFHDLYVRNCGNSVIVDRIGRLRDHLRRIWRHVGIRVDHTEMAYREHGDILDAMRSDDPTKLQNAVEKHIAGVAERVASCVIHAEP